MGSAKPKLPPMWSRVDVRKEVRDTAGRERMFDCLRQVDELGLIDEIGSFVRIERGALMRMPPGAPKAVRLAAQFGVDLFTLLEFTVRRVTRELDVMRACRAEATDIADLEQLLVEQVQVLMDWAHKAQSVLHWQALVSVAGIGGCDIQPLRRFFAASGIEATYRVVDCIRQAVLRPVQHPFLWFGLSRSARKRRLLQQGREKPASPRDTDADDRAILFAVAKGKELGKEVAAATKAHGQGSSESHVNKRKRDLRVWGLLGPGRRFHLSSEGEEWVVLMGLPDGRRV